MVHVKARKYVIYEWINPNIRYLKRPPCKFTCTRDTRVSEVFPFHEKYVKVT